MARTFMYPWDEWFSSKGGFTIKPDRDYTCQPHGMTGRIRNEAAARGLRVSLKVHDGGVIEGEVVGKAISSAARLRAKGSRNRQGKRKRTIK